MRCGGRWATKKPGDRPLGYYLSSLASVLMHLVQRTLRTYFPFSSTRTRWRLGLNLRRVARIEWLRRLPNMGPLPHISHLAMLLPRKMLQLTEEAVLMLPYRQTQCKVEVDGLAIQKGFYGGEHESIDL